MIDLDAIRARCNVAAREPVAWALIGRDVPVLIAEVERLRAEVDRLNIVVARMPHVVGTEDPRRILLVYGSRKHDHAECARLGGACALEGDKR